MISDLPQEVVSRFKQKPHHFLRGLVRALAPNRALLGIFAQMTGSHVAAVALDQALMWQMVVERDPARDDGWWWKSDAEWERELLITKRQMPAARQGLATACVEAAKRKRDGSPPTWHYRVVWRGFFEALAKALNTAIAKLFATLCEMMQDEDAQRAAAAAQLRQAVEADFVAQNEQVTKRHLSESQNVTGAGDETSPSLTSYTPPDSSSGVTRSESPPNDARGRALDGFSDPSWNSGERNFNGQGTQTPPPVPPPPSPLTPELSLAWDMYRDTNMELALDACLALIAGYGEEVCIAALRDLRRQARGVVRNRAGWLRSKIEFMTDPAMDAARRFDRGGHIAEQKSPEYFRE